MDDSASVTAHHEAGHAVAATMRGGSALREIQLHAQPGSGLTRFTSAPHDSGFIAYAGPWAEARLAWGDRDIGDEDEDGLTFDIHVTGVLLCQPADAEMVRAHERSLSKTLPPGVAASYTHVWEIELERVWPAVEEVAARLVAGAAVTDEEVRRAVECAWQAPED